MRTRTACALILVLALGVFAFAQNAPRETVSTSVGSAKVTVEYGRPALKGRNFSELTGQLPEDRIWRAGTDQITTLSADAPLMIGGKKVPAGKYSVYVHCPANGEYSLVLNSVLGQPLGKIWAAAPANLAKEPWPHFSYQKEIGDSEVARAAMKKAAAQNTDLLTYAFKGSTLTIAWGDQAWSIDMAAGK